MVWYCGLQLEHRRSLITPTIHSFTMEVRRHVAMPGNASLPYWISLERYSVRGSNSRGTLFEISVVTTRPHDEALWSKVKLVIVDESSDNENPETVSSYPFLSHIFYEIDHQVVYRRPLPFVSPT